MSKSLERTRLKRRRERLPARSARLYVSRKKLANEGHGFSRAVEYGDWRGLQPLRCGFPTILRCLQATKDGRFRPGCPKEPSSSAVRVARLYGPRKKLANEGHGFSRAVEYGDWRGLQPLRCGFPTILRCLQTTKDRRFRPGCPKEPSSSAVRVARLYGPRKKLANEGHGFSRAVEYGDWRGLQPLRYGFPMTAGEFLCDHHYPSAFTGCDRIT